MSADERFSKFAAAIGFPLDQPIKIGGNYKAILQVDHTLYVSGQIPRVGDEVRFVGRVGQEIGLMQAKEAAKVCVARGLALAQQHLGTLSRIMAVPRVCVFVRSADHFTQQSEVADGVSDALIEVLGEAGVHSRTSVGVLQLPKGAAIEVDSTFNFK